MTAAGDTRDGGAGPPAGIAEIVEADATGLVKRIYDDFKTVLGVGAVNLLLRHFATIPGCLDWVWAEWRPLYASGAMAAAAEEAFREVTLPDPGLGPDDVPTGPFGQGTADEAVRHILDFYGRSNPVNLVGLHYLLARLDGDGATLETGAGGGNGPASETAGPGRALPALIDPATLDPDTRAAIDRLQARATGPGGPMPSIYRHLAHWPALIRRLDAAPGAGTLDETLRQAARALDRRAADLARHLAAGPGPRKVAAVEARPRSSGIWIRPPAGDARARFLAFAAPFPVTIARMAILARALRAALFRAD